ncbi:MAG: DMSO reductase anchor subunit [Urechidicola sp.]|jgi:DMSO reductase anchor subunit
MKPAISVILLTTLIGVAQGLFLAYYSAELLSLLLILPNQELVGSGFAGIISLVLLVGGLIASFFHLGHPERAWRAATMWRTSWLSREVIALPITMGLIFIYSLLKLTGNDQIMFNLGNGNQVELATVVGFFAMIAVFALFICTAMIYTCLKFLREWHSPFTVSNFFLMGCASGFVLASALAAYYDPQIFGYISGTAMVFSVLALASRYASLGRNKSLRSPSTLQTAIGIHHPNIRQLAQGAMGGSYNTRAFIHTYGPAVVQLARRFFLIAGFIVPVLLLAISNESPVVICTLAFLIQYMGLLAERWYFFIEAKHPQNLYYQMIS